MAAIERVEMMLVDLPPGAVPADATQAFVSQETPIVRVTDADGAVGTGYAYTVGTGGSSIVRLLHDHLAPELIGREADAVEAVWRLLHRRTHATAVGAITSLALAAVDTALWDLRCVRAGLPLHVMAGGAQAGVPLYTAEGGWLGLSAEELVERAIEAREAGFGGCRMEVGRPHAAEDAARLEAVRAAVGPAFEVMLDADQAFTVDEALRRARRFEPLDPAWLAEPLPAEDLGGHVRLAAGTSLPVAAGGSLYSLQHLREYLQRGGCSVVQADAARIGGITPWLKAAHLAEAFNLPVCPHALTELHVALACAVPNGRWVEHVPQLGEITLTGVVVHDGRAVPSDEPGLGIAWDMEAVERRRVHELTLLVD